LARGAMSASRAGPAGISRTATYLFSKHR
jgi:hypothetical protein